MKKAAMFGLDARIALAIFGALSVISGAALYSAIQESKVTALLTEINEVGKAWEQFYLDTGSLPERMSTDTSTNSYYVFKTANLVTDNGATGWAGPYISTSMFRNARGEDVWLIQQSTNDWNIMDNGKCTTGLSCAMYVRFWKNPRALSASIIEALDARVDNSDGNDKGIFRWDTYAINYRYAPLSNPHD